MNLFQILAVSVVTGLLALSLLAMARGWATRREGLAWAFVWLCADIAIARPNLTTLVARTIGIRRGADLVLYCAVIVMLMGFFMVYARLRRLRRDLTVLTRHLAIREAASTSLKSTWPDDGKPGKKQSLRRP